MSDSDSAPVSPIEITAPDPSQIRSRFSPMAPQPTPAEIDELRTICPVVTERGRLADAGRDWWPISMHWALNGEVPAIATAIVKPRTTDEVAAVLAFCNARGIPVTAAGGRSGVCGASIPLCGGVIADLTDMAGVVSVDTVSNVVEVLPGTFGPDLECELDKVGLTVGHFPQSFAISTVGGWVACRGAGQMSTRYGKIEDMVCGLEVVLASGAIVRTGIAPRSASGPELDGVFIGSEGTLGIITRIWLRCHPRPTREERCSYAFPDFASGIDACRRIVQRGATPAVLRLYDAVETKRSHSGDGTSCALLVLDQGDPADVQATMSIVHEECLATDGCRPAPVDLVDAWMLHRNDTSALQSLTRKGFVVDTMEVAAPWSRLVDVDAAVRSALLAVEHSRSASCHLSHSYPDGACLYFSFAASPPKTDVDSTYIALWNAGTGAALDAGANLSHHHGIGLNRARFVSAALGSSFDVLCSLKDALDPSGILNPGKMGLRSKVAADHRSDDAQRLTSSSWPTSPWPEGPV